MFWRATVPAALAFCLLPLVLSAQQANSNDEIVDKVVAQERLEVQRLRQYAPLVETYIQYVRPDKDLIAVPDGDKYFLGRAKLANGVVLEPLAIGSPLKRKVSEDRREFLNVGFVPGGFLQMIYVDASGFDRQHYKFEYTRREFLGEVRCLVFDVAPRNRQEKGRFVGRIWVEDRDYHIVRFNGSYGQSFVLSYYFNFDSWRTNTDTGDWLPAFIYTEQGNLHDPQTKKLAFQPFRAQTRLWGYHLARSGEEQEMSKLTIETPMHDTTQSANDYSPLQAQRAFERQAETNVTDHLEWQGLLAPHGEVDQVLETVVNNLEVTNDLDVQPEIRCRVLMTSTLEAFTIGHTIVLSRGLVDVLPDEASLAAILAHELSHVVLTQGMNTEFAFFNSMDFKEKDTFRRFDFARSKEEELAAQAKANQLLSKSPYSESSATARLFLETLKKRSKDFPNLVSPHLGDRVPTDWSVASTAPSEEAAGSTAKSAVTAALPLGGRIKVDPWADRLQFSKSRPESPISEAEKMPFEVTPFMLYLTRQNDNAKPQGVASRLGAGANQK